MSEKIPKMIFPELFFGLVAPVGVDLTDSIVYLEAKLRSLGFITKQIKVTSVFSELNKKLPLDITLAEKPTETRYESYISYGDAVRTRLDEDAFFAATSIAKIIKERLELNLATGPERTAYIVHQFKRREEIELMRLVYGRLFFQISVYDKRHVRVDTLARKIASSHNSSDHNLYRPEAERLVEKDEDERLNPHGQRVGDIFHEADYIINTGINNNTAANQINRLLELIFGSNIISPTKMEYGLYMAKAASLRSLDLSRQVGAAVFSKQGEILTLGSNEVPKGTGGTYWCDDPFDDRDYKRGIDSNFKRKMEILRELLGSQSATDYEIVEKYRKTQFMDALEYGRMIHAEMSAICDAARRGIALDGAVLYTTTFPCHMCAKHIVATGISEVVFLEPYTKSLASGLHSDSISIEGQSRDKYEDFPSVLFKHFYGVSPKRYRDLFERTSRKDSVGTLQRCVGGLERPNIDIKLPVYLDLERSVLQTVLLPLLEAVSVKLDDLPSIDFSQSNALKAKPIAEQN
jgi:deoxycytidylate deaminase